LGNLEIGGRPIARRLTDRPQLYFVAPTGEAPSLEPTDSSSKRTASY
jgi:hypothetical protein